MTRKPSVVLDVNVIVSGFLKGGGPPVQIVRLWQRDDIAVVVSEHIIKTVFEVWDRPFFVARVDRLDRALALDLTHEQATHVSPDRSVTGVTDDDEDDMVLGTAVAAGADYLVTGDQGLLAVGEYNGVRIVTARQFLDIFERSD